jgi:hypothetical protein
VGISINRLNAQQLSRRLLLREGAKNLQKGGLIRYVRGRIIALDRERLEQRVCECYAVVQSEYDRLLPRQAH